MKYNFWRQLRLAGSVVVIISAFINNLTLTFIGLILISVGTVNSVTRLEDKIAALEAKNEQE